MSKIDLNNYEAFFFDYHEGMLDDAGKKEVELFLLKNPEYQSDFEAMGEAFLSPESSNELSWKNQLKKEPVNELSPKQLAILDHIEGGSTETSGESISVLTGINSSDLRLFELTRLTPEKISFPHASSLKSTNGELPGFLENSLIHLNGDLKLNADKKIVMPAKAGLKKAMAAENTRIIPLNFNWRVAAAAILLFAILGSLLINNPNPDAMLAMDGLRKVELRKEVLNEKETSYKGNATALNSTSDLIGTEAHSPNNTVEKEGHTNRVAMEEMTVRQPIKPFSTRLVNDKSLKTSTENQLALAQLQKNSIAVQEPVKVKPQKVLTLGEFAQQRLNKTLVDQETPEDGLLLALLDKTIEKIDQKSDSSIDLDIQVENKKPKSFSLQIGKFKIRK